MDLAPKDFAIKYKLMMGSQLVSVLSFIGIAGGGWEIDSITWEKDIYLCLISLQKNISWL